MTKKSATCTQYY